MATALHATRDEVDELEGRVRQVETGRATSDEQLRTLSKVVERLETTQARLVWALALAGVGNVGALLSTLGGS